MKICYNCNYNGKENDRYCRKCGLPYKKGSYYTIVSIINFVMILGIIFLISLFIASYYV